MSSIVPKRPHGSAGAGPGHHFVAKRLVLARRVDPARLDHVDVDSVRVELGGDRERQLVQSPLGGVVGDAPGIRDISVTSSR